MSRHRTGDRRPGLPPQADPVVREWARIAGAAGWRIAHTRDQHVVWYSPDPTTPPRITPARFKNNSGRRNARTDLRRIGCPVP